MLSDELMGLGALGILWVNTLLVVAAALRELGAMRARRRAMRPLGPGELSAGMIHGTITRGDGPGGALASRTVDQVGRFAGGDHERPAILFADRSYVSEVHGGAVSIEGLGAVGVAPLGPFTAIPAVRTNKTAPLEVWTGAEATRAATACPSDATFDEAYAHARKARGFARTVATRALVGTPVWVVGEVRRDASGAAVVTPAEDGTLVVSTFDPRSYCGSKLRLLVAFVIAVPVAAAACTLLALYPPYFGTVSTIGGGLGLAYFLLVQPAGTAIRDAVLSPQVSPVRGRWTRCETPPVA